MKAIRYVKIFLIICVVLAILVIGGITALVTLVNPNKYKPIIISKVYDQTGRTLKLDGNISWQVFPHLGFKLENASLSNPKGFTAPNSDLFFKLNSANISIELLPLLQHKVAVNTIEVSGLNLNLVKVGDKNNWSFSSESQPAATPNQAQEPAQPIRFELKAFKLDHANINYIDTTKNTNLAYKDINFSIGGDGISYDGKYNNLELDKVKIKFNDLLMADVDVEVKNLDNPSFDGKLDISKFQLSKLATFLNLPNAATFQKPLFSNITFKGGVSGDMDSAKLKDTSFNLSDALVGTITAQAKNLKKPNYNGEVNITKLNLNSLLSQNQIKGGDKPLLNQVTFKTKFVGDSENVTLNDLTFDLSKIISGSGNVAVKNLSNPNYQGNIKLNNFSLNNVMTNLKMAPSKYSGAKLFNSVALQTGFNGTKDQVNLSNLTFNLSQMLSGSANLAINNFSNPQIAGDLNVPTFSLSSVMQDLKMTPPKLENPNLLNKVSVKTKFNATKNSLNLNPLNLNLADSNIAGVLNISSFKPLALSENLNINKLEVSDLVNAKGYKIPMNGINASGNLSANTDNFIATLSGRQNIKVNNIQVYGFSADELIRTFDNILSAFDNIGKGGNLNEIANSATGVGLSIDKMKAYLASLQTKGAKNMSKRTNLGVFNAALAMNNGKINPSNFTLKGSSVDVDGNGALNLNNQAIDYNVNAKLLTPKIHSILHALVFPAHVSGTLNDIQSSVDWMNLTGQVTKYVVANTKNQLADQAKKALSDQAKKALGDNAKALGGATDQVTGKVVDAVSNLFGN